MIPRRLGIGTIVILFLVLVWRADPLAPPPDEAPVRIQLTTPRVAVWPSGTFRVRAIIERHADNRLLVIEFDGPEYKRSDYQIQGAQRQRVFAPERVEFDAVGEYVAIATLVRITDGHVQRFQARTDFRIIGGLF